MKGLLWKDCLTIRKKYGLPRLVLDLAILAALLVVLWMFRGDFPGDVPVAMLYLTVLALIQAWFLGADGAAQS